MYFIIYLNIGIGFGQVFATGMLTSYYASLLALTLRYFLSSFQSVLPWSTCKAEWESDCIDSLQKNYVNHTNRDAMTHLSTSAELYF